MANMVNDGWWEYGFHIFVEKIDERLSVFVDFSPYRQFRLQIHALFISCGEACLRWVPRMESDVVYTVALDCLEIFAPRLDVHRHVGGQGPYACVVPTSEESRFSVYRELGAGSGKFTESGLDFTFVERVSRCVGNGYPYIMERGRPFAPKRGVFPHWERDVESS